MQDPARAQRRSGALLQVLEAARDSLCPALQGKGEGEPMQLSAALPPCCRCLSCTSQASGLLQIEHHWQAVAQPLLVLDAGLLAQIMSAGRKPASEAHPSSSGCLLSAGAHVGSDSGAGRLPPVCTRPHRP